MELARLLGVLPLPLALILAVADCGSTVDAHDAREESCTLAPPGKPFQFVIRNVGVRNLTFALGCGTNLPFVIDTDAGPFGIGAANAEGCGYRCEWIYEGQPNRGCSDCGPGVSEPLPPGGTVTFDWDRRVRVPHVAKPHCAGFVAAQEYEYSCALPVDAGDASTGELYVCSAPGSFGGSCDAEEEVRSFSFDPDLDSVTIDIE